MSDVQNKPSSDFVEKFRVAFDTATKLKRVMQKKSLRVAKAKCPKCDGLIYGRLCGPKDHIHMACDTCDLRVME